MIIKTLTPEKARAKNPLALAYIGDCVYDMYFRTQAVCESDAQIAVINRQLCAKVNAGAQAKAVALIEDMLSEDEADIFKRGRNAKVKTVPKNMNRADYHMATALEALIGYCYITGNIARVYELLGKIAESEE